MQKYRLIGILAWAAAMIAFIWSATLPENKSISMQMVLALAVFVYMPFLIYSWLFGPQKGHPAHLMMIGLSFIFSVAFNFRDQLGSAAFGIIVLGYLVANFSLAGIYRKRFLADAKIGKRNNYFNAQ